MLEHYRAFLNRRTTSMMKLLERKSRHYGEAEYHKILATIHKQCYVESEEKDQRGDITGIVRDKWGVPIAVYVGLEGKEQCINLEDVNFFEPYYRTLLTFVTEDRFFTTIYPYNGKPERVW